MFLVISLSVTGDHGVTGGLRRVGGGGSGEGDSDFRRKRGNVIISAPSVMCNVF